MQGRKRLIVDDMIATGGTIAEGVRALQAAGADPHAVVAATHGLFLNNASRKLTEAGVREIHVTDSVAVGTRTGPNFTS